MSGDSTGGMVRVRTIRQHIGSDGQKWPGDEYERLPEDAATLAKMGVVELVSGAEKPTTGKPKAGKAK